ncbi:LysM peptidoglycan-binding domain-containing protein [Ornithinibacillus sp. 4-3]|uniref:LysM peptidoglycan-binding domain-containing protein n=1 Tax=Ornithinibacillus sp. 4-3 TaxID=3231488 RepID=A0AB39HQ02_9BACI
MRKLVAILFASTIVFSAATTVSAAEYEIQKGDTLWKIAKKHNTTVDRLKKINNLQSSLIHPKQLLQVDEGQGKQKPVNNGDKRNHKVVKGDTLSEIAQQYSVTVGQLKNWNNLSSDLILIGQNLSINGTDAKPAAKPSKPAQQEAKKEEKPAPKQVKVEPKQEEAPKNEEKQSAKTFTMKATAYTAECDGCSGITKTGIDLNKDRNAKVIAVDPNVIPLGTKVHVEGYGEAIAGDIGGAIKGDRIDIHVPTKSEAYQWGVRNVNVTILD